MPYPAPAAQPRPIPVYSQPIAIPQLEEIPEEQPRRKFAASSAGLWHSFVSSKIAKIIGVLLIIFVAASAVIYFIGFNRLSQKLNPTTAPSHSEEVLPAALFSVDQKETISLQIGQKKNLAQELSKLADKDYAAGKLYPGFG